MKKGIMTGMLLLLLGAIAQAQTFNEWFRQKKTQLKYLRQQIAALEAYIKVTEEGYSFVDEGMRQIAAFKQGDLDLHSGHFASLFRVSPAIGQYTKVDATRSLQEQIGVIAGQIREWATILPAWSDVINSCYTGLWKECTDNAAQLKVLTTDGELEMQDGERMAAIDRVYERMKRCYEAAIRARNDITVLLINEALWNGERK